MVGDAPAPIDNRRAWISDWFITRAIARASAIRSAGVLTLRVAGTTST
jgi:hypothetical protein